jgi:hypothetical protein
MPQIVRDLATLVDSLHLPRDWRRLRLAVTAEEFAEIKAYMLDHGEFLVRIRGVLLIVDEDPSSVEFWSEKSFRFVDAREDAA